MVFEDLWVILGPSKGGPLYGNHGYKPVHELWFA